jgi:hypothetical protein
MNKVKSFVKEFAAILKGDNAEATAQKALRQADSALKTQIASLKGDTIVVEDALTTAQEVQALARVNNGKAITNREGYVRGLLDAKNNVTYAEEALKTHNEKIAFLESELKALSEEVEG